MRITNLIILIILFMVLGHQDLQGGEPNLVGRWKQLSNQKDLTGWEVVGAGDWTMERVEQPLEVQRTKLTTTEGEIVVRRRPGEEAGGWLVTRGDYADFILRLKVKMISKSNSGILIRDPGHAKFSRPAYSGFEIQVTRMPIDTTVTAAPLEWTQLFFSYYNGAIRDLARGIGRLGVPRREELKGDDWDEFEIVCIGDHITSYMNGNKTAEIHNKRSYNGAIGLHLYPGSEAAHIRWKDIEIMELPKAPRSFQYMEQAAEQAPGEYRDLFAGKTIEDFDLHWPGAEWTLENGVLRGEQQERAVSWIVLKGEEYSDFILSIDMRIPERGNGGLTVRFPRSDAPIPIDYSRRHSRPFITGYMMKIRDPIPRPESSKRRKLFGNTEELGTIEGYFSAPVVDSWGQQIYRTGTWAHLKMYLKGDHIVFYVNGTKTAEMHNTKIYKGRIGFQCHASGSVIEFKNARVKILQ